MLTIVFFACPSSVCSRDVADLLEMILAHHFPHLFVKAVA